MQSAIAFTGGKKVGFVSGIKWIALQDHPGRNRVTADVRAKAALGMADKILIHSVDAGQGVQSTLGAYVANEFDVNAAAVKTVHSLAVTFVLAFPENLNQILAWRIDKERVAVIVVQDGLPIVDEIKGDAEAVKLMKDALSGKLGGVSGHAIYSNDPPRFLNALSVEDTAFVKAANRSSKLINVPVRPAVVLALVTFAAVLLGGSAFAYTSHVKQAKAKILKEQAAQDPVPAYQDLLAVRIGHLGLDRRSMMDTLDALGNKDVLSEGWLLNQVECNAGQCITSWDRIGGTTAALLRAHPDEVLLPESTSEKAMLMRKMPLVESGLQGFGSAVPLAEARAEGTATFQMWRNAKINVSELEDPKEFKTWPTPNSGDLSRLPKELTLKAKPITVTLPYPLAVQAVKDSPKAIWWSSFILKYAPSDDTKRLMVTLQGQTYAK